MPAIYGLIFITPSVVVDYLGERQINFFRDRTIDQLFQLMIKDKNIPVKFDYDVIVSTHKAIFQCILSFLKQN